MLLKPGQRIDNEGNIPYGAVEKGGWEDGIAYVIGAGPSLMGFDFSVLDGYTVGANKSAFVAETDILYSMDWKFIENFWEDIRDFEGEKYLNVMAKNRMTYVPGAVYLRSAREGSLSTDPKMTVGLNSGYGALNIAFLKGAKRIHLLGFDMQVGSVKHFHGGYEWDKSKGASYNSWARRFKFAKTKLEEHQIEVINYVGPKGSGISSYFPTRPLKELDPKYPQ